VACRGAELLFPAFERHGGRKGRLSLQTDPAYYRDADRIVAQARRFDALAPNIQVKMPVTIAGLAAIEEATYQGININATVQFTVAQALAVGDAVEHGLRRREREGLPIDNMAPVCSIMVGRLDDWLHVLEKRDGIIETPGYIDWAGVAVMKRAYALFQERGYRARLLVAAYRHHLHWSQHIGGDLIVSIPPDWQALYNASDVEVRDNMSDPVAPVIIDHLLRHFPAFRQAYEPDGLTVDEFDNFGPTVRTLRQFLAAASDLYALVRDFMLPNPDVR
jgi:transaldolase